MRLSLGLALLGVFLLLVSWLPTPWTTGDTAGQPSAVTADAAYGRTLFSVKGCAQCHELSTVAGSGRFFGGPGLGNPTVLSTYKAVPDYLRLWLKDPKSVKATATMPNLGLSQDEIEALIAFLQQTSG